MAADLWTLTLPIFCFDLLKNGACPPQILPSVTIIPGEDLSVMQPDCPIVFSTFLIKFIALHFSTKLKSFLKKEKLKNYILSLSGHKLHVRSKK
jgi:hypothetical protein